MAGKTLAAKKVRIEGTDKGVEVVAHRNKVGDYVYYSVSYYPATVRTDALSNGVEYDVFTFEPFTKPVKVWSEQTEKATAKLNGFYEGLVEFVAVEFANGVRTL